MYEYVRLPREYEEVAKNELPIRFIWYIIKKYGIDIRKYWDTLAYDEEDLFQEGAIIYYLSKKEYDSTKGMTLQSWFKLKFINEILKKKRYACEQKRGGSQRDKTTIRYIRINNIDKKDIQIKEEGFEEQLIEDFHTKELAIKLKTLKKQLSSKQIMVLNHWLLGLNQKESAKILGVNPATIFKTRDRITEEAKRINGVKEEVFEKDYNENKLINIFQEKQEVLELIQSLTKRQKEVLYYSWVRGLSNKQCAKVLNINIRALDKLKSRIRKQDAKNILKLISN